MLMLERERWEIEGGETDIYMRENDRKRERERDRERERAVNRSSILYYVFTYSYCNAIG